MLSHRFQRLLAPRVLRPYLEVRVAERVLFVRAAKSVLHRQLPCFDALDRGNIYDFNALIVLKSLRLINALSLSFDVQLKVLKQSLLLISLILFVVSRLLIFYDCAVLLYFFVLRLLGRWISRADVPCFLKLAEFAFHFLRADFLASHVDFVWVGRSIINI